MALLKRMRMPWMSAGISGFHLLVKEAGAMKDRVGEPDGGL